MDPAIVLILCIAATVFAILRIPLKSDQKRTATPATSKPIQDPPDIVFGYVSKRGIEREHEGQILSAYWHDEVAYFRLLKSDEAVLTFRVDGVEWLHAPDSIDTLEDDEARAWLYERAPGPM